VLDFLFDCCHLCRAWYAESSFWASFWYSEAAVLSFTAMSALVLREKNKAPPAINKAIDNQMIPAIWLFVGRFFSEFI
jgi:hypothetical protein